ncbi:antibiotic biosynthesis monooxygenase (plasmid) [Streptomyces sp. P8-A8]|uniref:antibiotic biosynthesis monooxygenase family protein n=1 Tax=unclassified Streptomyces TaxID=2593676 RepID=UPI002DDBD57E|nr:antibiotic biosynthesis monooxygenase family protein [Streptomyces sp. NBC_01768]WSC33894.1 antibiotic biosynthesis monooxygenase [Streptomyces sp. NBC_01768]
MPLISPDDGHLTVFNLFETDTVPLQEDVLDAMRDIIDNADYPGWISSTLHAGVDEPGTVNYIQWRSAADLQARYEGQKFQRRTVPLFHKLARTVRLLKTELAFSQHHPSLDGGIEISPQRDDYTVLIVLDTKPEDQRELLDTLTEPDEWIKTVPGYRSHTYFRGADGTFVVNYAQWESKELYDAFHTLPEEKRPAGIRNGRNRARSLVTGRQANTYRVTHSRSAKD